MTRTTAREIAIQLSFTGARGESIDAALDTFFDEEHYSSLSAEDRLFGERPDEEQMAFIRRCVAGVAAHRDEFDSLIEAHAKGWRAERISKTAMAVMRQALYELLYEDEIPPQVTLNEAVEIAKGYDEGEIVSFVNGVLGGIYRADHPEAQSDPDTSAAENTTEAAQDAPILDAGDDT